MHTFFSPLCVLLTISIVLPSDAFGQSPATGKSPDSDEFTVMTWNLEWFYDEYRGDNISDLSRKMSAPDRASWDWKRDQIAARIAMVKPTVVAVQETENRRVLYYLCRSLSRNHDLRYDELAVEGRDYFTEQDVGFIFRSPLDADSLIQKRYPRRLRSSNEYYDVSKHLIACFDIEPKESNAEPSQRVYVVNVHLRSRPEGEPFRLRQARLLHRWIRSLIADGNDVIVLGDFNTEQTGDRTLPDSELGITAGLHTEDPRDDLIDLTLRIPSSHRQTHILPGKQFDRIFCSRSLLVDDPDRPDLVFRSIQIMPQLAIQGDSDPIETHFESYWSIAPEERDLSDHYPVVATFQIR